MNPVTLLGIAAGILTTLAFLPQVIRTWRTKSAADLSFTTFILFCVGVVLWLCYGILLRDLPIILANGVTLVLAATVLGLMIRYRLRDRARDRARARASAGAPRA